MLSLITWRREQLNRKILAPFCALMMNKSFCWWAWVSILTEIYRKKSISPVGTILGALDHDMSQCSLTLSFYFKMNVPESIDKSFCRGNMFVTLKVALQSGIQLQEGTYFMVMEYPKFFWNTVIEEQIQETLSKLWSWETSLPLSNLIWTCLFMYNLLQVSLGLILLSDAWVS